MTPTLFEDLEQTLQASGPDAAIDRLCTRLRDASDFHGLFYALLMKKRHELGLSPIPTASNQDLPADVHAQFEDAIRNAARTVGSLFLEQSNIPGAFAYFRMIGEPEPVKEALEKTQLPEDQDSQPIIEIAFHQGVHPRRGFDWILQRYGICNAITTLSGGEIPFGTDVRNYCISRLIHALHNELLHRLRGEIANKQGFEPTGKTIPELIQGRDWLFADDFYHIDLSHLSSVVQMSIHLDAKEDLLLARELCAYGKRLSSRFTPQMDPPFENQYEDFDTYLSVLTGENVEAGLAHFRAKADAADPNEVGTYPAEVLVNLLLKLNRRDEALVAARKYLGHVSDARLSCPNLVELCQQTNSYGVLADIARENNNPVNFLAGLIGSKGR